MSGLIRRVAPACKPRDGSLAQQSRAVLPLQNRRSCVAGYFDGTDVPQPSACSPHCRRHRPARRRATRSTRLLCQAVKGTAEPTARFVVRSWAVPFGEHLRIVGSGPTLGDWDPAGGVMLEWSEGNDWFGEAPLPPGTATFKIVRVHDGTPTEWEVGEDRIIEVPDAPGPVAVTVDGASVSVTVDGAAADVQEEQVELVAERIEALRAQQEDESAPAASEESPTELEPVSALLGGDETVDLPPESLPSPSGPAPETPEPPAIAAAVAETAPLPKSELEPAADPEIESEPAPETSTPEDDATPVTAASANGATPAPSAGITEADGSVTYNFPAVDKTMQEKAAAFLEIIKSRLYGSSSS